MAKLNPKIQDILTEEEQKSLLSFMRKFAKIHETASTPDDPVAQAKAYAKAKSDGKNRPTLEPNPDAQIQNQVRVWIRKNRKN